VRRLLWRKLQTQYKSGKAAAGGLSFLSGDIFFPLAAALPRFAGGLGFNGYLTRRKKRAQV
jgi:hypothetical protein